MRSCVTATLGALLLIGGNGLLAVGYIGGGSILLALGAVAAFVAARSGGPEEPRASRLGGGDLAIAGGTYLVAVSLRLFRFHEFGTQIGDFNGRRLRALWDMLQGTWHFPVGTEAMEHAEMAATYLLLPTAWLTRCDWSALRVTAVLIAALLPVVIYLYLRPETGRGPAFLAAAALAASRFFVVADRQLYRMRYPLFLMLGLAAAMLLFHPARRGRILRAAAAGVLLAGSVYVVSHAVPMVLTLGAAAAMRACLPPRRDRWLAVLVMVLAAAAVLAPLVAFHLDHPGVRGYKSHRFAWGMYPDTPPAELIRQQAGWVLGALALDGGFFRDMARGRGLLHLPWLGLALGGLAVFLRHGRRSRLLYLALLPPVYLIWLGMMNRDRYTGHFYVFFLVPAMTLGAAFLGLALRALACRAGRHRPMVEVVLAVTLAAALVAWNAWDLFGGPHRLRSNADGLYGYYRLLRAREPLPGPVMFDRKSLRLYGEGEFPGFSFLKDRFDLRLGTYQDREGLLSWTPPDGGREETLLFLLSATQRDRIPQLEAAFASCRRVGECARVLMVECTGRVSQARRTSSAE